MHDMKADKVEEETEATKSDLSVGMKCKAKYSDGQYYDVTIDEIAKDGKYLVTWTDYGTQDELDASDFKVRKKSSSSRSSSKRDRSSDRSERRSKSPSSSRSRKSRSPRRDRKKDKRSRTRSSSQDRRKSKDNRDRRKKSGSRSRSPKRSSRKKSKSPDQNDIEKEILRQEREAALAQGTDYARKPVGYKKALSLQLTTGSSRRKSRSRSRSRDRDRERDRERDRDRRDRNRDRPSASSSYRNRSVSPPKKKEMTAAQKMQMSKLKEIYGDASGGKNAKSNYAAAKPSAKVDSEDVLRLGFS